MLRRRITVNTPSFAGGAMLGALPASSLSQCAAAGDSNILVARRFQHSSSAATSKATGSGSSSKATPLPASSAYPTCALLQTHTIYQGNTPMTWEMTPSAPSNAEGAATTSDQPAQQQKRSGRLVAHRIPLASHMATFGMPKGYPLSCAPGYGRFFGAYIMHSFISNFSMSIATQALLGGFFAESTPQVWMIKDLAPSLIAAYLANRVASYEHKPKYWMITSVALSQGASIMDLMIPLVVAPKYFLAAAIATAVIKNNAVLMHFVARATVLQHFAIYQNLGEVQKKLNSFGMINYPIATALGIVYTTLFPSFTVHAVTVGVCSVTAVALMHYSLSHVAFRNLTPITGQLVMERYISTRFAGVASLEEVRQLIGITSTIEGNHYVEKQFIVNPPLTRVVLTPEGTLFAGEGIHFTIGVWEVRDRALSVGERYSVTGCFGKLRQRWQRRNDVAAAGSSPTTSQSTAAAAAPTPTVRTRLVLFVHRKCPAPQLFLAHLLCYAALHDIKAKEAFAGKQYRALVESTTATTTTSTSSSSKKKSPQWVCEWVDAVRSFFSPELLQDFVKGGGRNRVAAEGANAASSRLTAALEAVLLELEASASATRADGKGNENTNQGTPSGPSASSNASAARVDPRAWVKADCYAAHDAQTWMRRTAILMDLLKQEGWDIVTPSLDPLEGRISTVPENEEVNAGPN